MCQMRGIYGGEMKAKSIKLIQGFINIKLNRIEHMQDRIEHDLVEGRENGIDMVARNAYETPYYDLYFLLTVLSVEEPETFLNDFQALFD